MASEKRNQQYLESDRRNARRISLKLNLENDGDILYWLDHQHKSIQGAIKDAIRYYIQSLCE